MPYHGCYESHCPSTALIVDPAGAAVSTNRWRICDSVLPSPHRPCCDRLHDAGRFAHGPLWIGRFIHLSGAAGQTIRACVRSSPDTLPPTGTGTRFEQLAVRSEALAHPSKRKFSVNPAALIVTDLTNECRARDDGGTDSNRCERSTAMTRSMFREKLARRPARQVERFELLTRWCRSPEQRSRRGWRRADLWHVRPVLASSSTEILTGRPRRGSARLRQDPAQSGRSRRAHVADSILGPGRKKTLSRGGSQAEFRRDRYAITA
jgi:hypothetical protein